MNESVVRARQEQGALFVTRLHQRLIWTTFYGRFRAMSLAGLIAKISKKGACLELWMVSGDAAPRAVSKTGLGSVVSPLDVEFQAMA